ncbi:MAG TPA: LacI family DNA-binding transcriptional regulator [Prolixibacteraceae bacterium]|nr:LacI family DNA-binding transcriptional regulator [Prolixibacteraceae bacterium]
MEGFKNIRIKDIAEMAGVSVATVDRVLHRRGKISEKALSKVMDALEQTGFKPNLIASTLGSNKTFRIAALLPDPALDDYWRLSAEGIIKAKEDWGQYNVHIESFYFNLYEKTSFKEVADRVLDFQPDGVLVAPIFHRESLVFFDILHFKGIPYILFNTNIPEAKPISFIGQDLYQSGRVGAEMLSGKVVNPGNIAVMHIYEEIQNAVHLKEKERGFRDFFADNKLSNFTVSSYDFGNCDESEFDRNLLDVITRDDITGIFVTTSKGSHLTASVLDQSGKKNIVLVGYDLLQDNIHYMYNGVINFLINQNPQKQAFLGISYLVNFLVFKKQPPASDLFPLEIITKENIKSYLYSGVH